VIIPEPTVSHTADPLPCPLSVRLNA
jgi:hypothetical protein